MRFSELKELGLDNNEIIVYVNCLTEEGITVKEISRKAGLIRTTTYGIVQSLLEKGLVSKVNKDKVQFFKAVNPDELLTLLDQKKKKVQSILPELKRIRKNERTEQRVDFFEGKNSVRAITNDLISRPNQVVRVIGAGKKWIEFSQTFAKVYYRQKKERNVQTKAILTDNKEERGIFDKGIIKNTNPRFSKDINMTQSAMFIYQDKVSFVTYDIDNVRGFIIKDKEFKRSQEVLFENLWKNSKEKKRKN